MNHSKRIVVLGSAGTGKTTLARRLSHATGAKMICLDAIWQPNWSKEDVPSFRELLVSLHSEDHWVSDGNFAQATFDIRLPRATMIVWLERPRLSSSWNALKRVLRTNEHHRVADSRRRF